MYHMKTECGVLGYFSKNNMSDSGFKFLLKNLQHRGQDSCGIAWYENNEIKCQKKVGHVKKLIEEPLDIIKNIFIGHTRYITANKNINKLESAHPILSKFKSTQFAFVYNGNIPTTENDIEYILNYFKTNMDKSFESCLVNFIKLNKRAFNIIFLYNNKFYIIRDRYGTRPLNILIDEKLAIVSSETCIAGNDYNFKSIDAGTLTIVQFIDDKLDVETRHVIESSNLAKCLFEYIYFMDKRSIQNDITIAEYRILLGKLIAVQERESNCMALSKCDKNNVIVCGIPNSAIEYGKGYADCMKFNYNQFITKNIKILRTFIGDSQEKREYDSNAKYIFNTSMIKGKDIVIVDDSIVRGITIRNIINRLKSYNPNSIHIRVGCPPIINTCNLGVDIPNINDLVRNHHLDVESLQKEYDVESLIYLNLEKINKILPLQSFCTGCMDGNYSNDKILDW